MYSTGNLYFTTTRSEDAADGKTYVCEAQNRKTRTSSKGSDKTIHIIKGSLRLIIDHLAPARLGINQYLETSLNC